MTLFNIQSARKSCIKTVHNAEYSKPGTKNIDRRELKYYYINVGAISVPFNYGLLRGMFRYQII